MSLAATLISVGIFIYTLVIQFGELGFYGG